MAQEASGNGLHDAATAFLDAATKMAQIEAKDKTDLVCGIIILVLWIRNKVQGLLVYSILMVQLHRFHSELEDH